MAKGKNRKSNRDDTASNIITSSGKVKKTTSTTTTTPKSSPGNEAESAAAPKDTKDTSSKSIRSHKSLYQLMLQERQGLIWVLGCALLGEMMGFGIGSGYLMGETGPPNAWRVALGVKIRSSTTYKIVTGNIMPWEPFAETWRDLSRDNFEDDDNIIDMLDDPSHPKVFAILREAVIREKGGYIHPDLGPLVPAPSGATRGLGMVRDSYHQCQTNCLPGVASEKMEAKLNKNATKTKDSKASQKKHYKQEEVLLKIPLSFQMTRQLALDTLLPRISAEVQKKANLHELDDAALLVLLLAHERGFGRYSRWLPYILSLPQEASCGYSQYLRPYMLDSVNAYRDELGLDVNGWETELLKATQYAQRIANGLTKDYGSFISHPTGISTHENIEWALCTVASRATGGSQKHGALRLVPILDMVNHDASAGGFVELTGKERLQNDDFVDASEDDSGAFVIRSLRHGRRKALRKGQELLANYNVPHYSALDWFVSLGFVPPERWNKWQKVDSALPRIRRDGPFAEDGARARVWRDHSTD
jgi:hypothetical protein